jgi:type I restriction enzyme S subunit
VREHLPSNVYVWVFGSRAKWTAKAYSDLDLALEGDAAIPAKSLAAFEVALEESTLPFKVDVVDMHAVSDSFRQIIDRDKVALLVAKKQAGGLPEGWREVSLSETLSIVTDKIPAASVTPNNYISTDNMLIDRGGVVAATSLPEIEKFNAYLPDDTLFSNIRTYFKKVWFADRQGGASPDVLIFRTKDRYVLQPRYLYYILSGQEFIDFTVLTAKGAKMPRGDKTAILRHSIALPPLPEQKAIAAILGALDDKIEANRKMNATLEGIARVLFKSWFVDFDPVRAKAEGRPSGLPADLDSLFPASFIDSPLGEIPMGWRVEKAGDLFNVGIGKTPPRGEHHWFSTETKDVRWVSIRDMGACGVFIANSSECLTQAAVERFNIKQIPDNTVLLSFKLTLGRVAISDGVMVSNEAIAHFCKKVSFLSSEYLFAYLKEFDFSCLGSTSSIATAINSKTVRDIPVIVPSQNVHSSYVAATAATFDKIKWLHRQNQTLATLRDTLLPKLISGQIRVGDAENIMEKAL